MRFRVPQTGFFQSLSQWTTQLWKSPVLDSPQFRPVRMKISIIRCAKESGEDSVRPANISGRSRPASARNVGTYHAGTFSLSK
jgi:hypothetical protein